MARLVNAKCPECGASMKIDPTAHVAECPYCGCTARIAGSRNTSLPAPDMEGFDDMPVIVLRDRSLYLWIIGAIVGILVLIFGVAYTIEGLDRSTDRGLNLSMRDTLKLPAIPGENLAIEGLRKPMLVDIDGDGVKDVVAWTCFNCDKQGVHHLAAWNTESGQRLWVTEPISEHDKIYGVKGSIAAVADGALLAANTEGLLTSYSLTTGEAVWSTACGQEVNRICRPAAGILSIELKGGTVLSVHGASGQVTDEGKSVEGSPCPGVLTDTAGVERGLIKTPRLTDAYPGKLPQIDGMDVKAAFVHTETGYGIAVGPETLDNRRAGTVAAFNPGVPGPRKGGHRVPMWKVPVSGDDELYPTRELEKIVGVSEGRVLIPYRVFGGWRMACKNLADGRGLWDVSVPLSDKNKIRSVQATGSHVFVTIWSSIVILDAKDGEARMIIGG